MLDAALFGKFQKPLDGIDVVLLIQVVDGRGAFDALVDARSEYEAFAALHVSAHFVVRHLEIVAVLDLHFGRQDGARGQGRKCDARYFVPSCNELLGGFRAQKPRTADHKYFHKTPPLR